VRGLLLTSAAWKAIVFPFAHALLLAPFAFTLPIPPGMLSTPPPSPVTWATALEGVVSVHQAMPVSLPAPCGAWDLEASDCSFGAYSTPSGFGPILVGSVIVLAFRLGRVRVCGLVFSFMIVLVSYEVTASTSRVSLVSTFVSLGTTDVLSHVLRHPNVSVCCLVALCSGWSAPGTCVTFLEHCSDIMASAMGGTISSRTCGCVAVFVICIICSRGVGSSAATIPT